LGGGEPLARGPKKRRKKGILGKNPMLEKLFRRVQTRHGGGGGGKGKDYRPRRTTLARVDMGHTGSG